MNDRKFLKTRDGEEVIIRNRKRAVGNTVPPNREQYIPEHKRLNLEPQIYSHNKDDFRMYAPKRKENNQKNPNVKVPFVHSGQNTNWSQENIVDEGVFNDLINYDGVEVPEELDGNYEVDNRGNNETNEEFSILDVQPGQYILLCENDVIQCGSLQEIEAAIEHLLISSDNGEELYNRLFVFKRVSVRTGVFVDEKSV